MSPTIGLRIDVDTFRGTLRGVPNLCRVLAEHGIKATFFFSVGPDNMGRHLWRLIRPAFFLKMWRTRAAKLYGWDVLLRGAFWPGPCIGERLGKVIRAAADAGHEVGLHAWDHHAWQSHIEEMDSGAVYRCLRKGFDLLSRITGQPPSCSAAPAWKCNNIVLEEKEKFPFHYNSDCRGESIFRPVVAGRELSQPQVPATLPTYDEAIGRSGVTDENYNDYLLFMMQPEGLNVLTIHAEVEGIVCFDMFRRFLETAQARGFSLAPLGSLFDPSRPLGQGVIVPKEIPGREGWAARQSTG